MNIYPDSRYGHFFLPNQFIREFPVSTRQIMGTMIPAKCEQNLCVDALEGWAWCPDFDPVLEGNVAPDYEAHMDMGRIVWKRIS